MPSVKAIFRLRSGVRKTRAMALNKGIPPERSRRATRRTRNQTNPEGADGHTAAGPFGV